MELKVKVDIPPALAADANGRDFIKTVEFARAFNIKPQTARKNFCLFGHCFGVRPKKFGRDLNWPVLETAIALTK